jgi:hypothetical protein
MLTTKPINSLCNTINHSVIQQLINTSHSGHTFLIPRHGTVMAPVSGAASGKKDIAVDQKTKQPLLTTLEAKRPYFPPFLFC